MTKIEKAEILRHYRIANYKDIKEMLELIAVKKGLVDTGVEIVNKKKVKTTTPNVAEAARRLIRDFLANRIQYCSQVPQL